MSYVDARMQVADKSKEEGEKPRKQAIVEVMVDLLLDMEGITEHKGLVYVLDEGLEIYPVSDTGGRSVHCVALMVSVSHSDGVHGT